MLQSCENIRGSFIGENYIPRRREDLSDIFPRLENLFFSQHVAKFSIVQRLLKILAGAITLRS